MKPAHIRSLLILLLFIILGDTSATGLASSTSTSEGIVATPLEYTVDLNDRSGDTFKVSLRVGDLTSENGLYQFASTAPGTYQVMDIGRLVRSFEAVDASGTIIPSEKVSTNQYVISDPERVVEIHYTIAETWDTPVDENPIYLMAGTSIENDHVLINGQAVFGYPTGMQDRALHIRLEYPTEWLIGTALPEDEDGTFLAKNYDHAVDSPILLGRLSTAHLDVRGTSIDLFTYSKTDVVKSEMILESTRDILNSAADFLGKLPVDRYAFLFHFEDVSNGAWEHSYSSEYVFAEAGFQQAINQGIPSIVAHEFFHIVQPLNIHSEIIEHFNFVEPVASEHVWLYEGTTEWMAQMAQLRSGLIDLDTYLQRISGKMAAAENFDTSYSLSELSLNSYSKKGQQEWGNIYQRGAVVAGLLDLDILSLSGGSEGLRDVILELADTYGPDTSFVEAGFFDEVTAMTYPEIRSFFEDYVRDTKTLPIARYYHKVGIQYIPEYNTGNQIARFGLQVGLEGQDLVVTGGTETTEACGIQNGDVLVRFNDLDISLKTAQRVFGQLQALAADEEFVLRVRRDGEEHDYTCAKETVDQITRHFLRADPDATPEQLALRKAWMSNR